MHGQVSQKCTGKPQIQTMDYFCSVFKLMGVSKILLIPGDDQFHLPASFNMNSIADIHFAYTSCC